MPGSRWIENPALVFRPGIFVPEDIFVKYKIELASMVVVLNKVCDVEDSDGLALSGALCLIRIASLAHIAGRIKAGHAGALLGKAPQGGVKCLRALETLGVIHQIKGGLWEINDGFKPTTFAERIGKMIGQTKHWDFLSGCY